MKKLVVFVIALVTALFIWATLHVAHADSYYWHFYNGNKEYTLELDEACQRDRELDFILCYAGGRSVASWRWYANVAVGKAYTQKKLKNKNHEPNINAMKVRVIEFVRDTWSNADVTAIGADVVTNSQGITLIQGWALIKNRDDNDSVAVVLAQIWQDGSADEIVVTMDAGDVLERNMRITANVLYNMTFRRK